MPKTHIKHGDVPVDLRHLLQGPEEEDKAQSQTLIVGGPSACYTAWTEAKRLPLGTETRSECGQSANVELLLPPTLSVQPPC